MQIPFGQLIAFASRRTFQEAIANRRWEVGEVPYSDVRGYHLYSDLGLRLAISAAESDEAAYRNLQILQAYVSAAESAGEVTGMTFLEVQGRRLHLFREAASADDELAEEVRRGCRAFYELARRKILDVAPGTEFTIRMALDYGRAILLRSVGDDVSESIVSLGNAANRPAKKLARDVDRSGVPAGYLAINETAFGQDENQPPVWRLVDLTAPIVSRKTDDLLGESMVAFSAIENRARPFEPNPHNPVNAPRKRRGFMFRADLDGFSSRVSDAMSSGADAISSLVADFQVLMSYPVAFKDTLPDGVSVVAFPWAGDCANLLLECDDYAVERTYLPNRAAINWHDQGRGLAGNGTDWRSRMRGSKWLVAIAGGEQVEKEHGFILTGNVLASGRTFHVGSGWSWQRSLDAEQSTGTRPEDTVIHNEDYGGLDEPLRRPYSEHAAQPALFKIAPFDRLVKAQRDHDDKGRVSVPATVPSLGIKVNSPRPYVSH